MEHLKTVIKREKFVEVFDKTKIFTAVRKAVEDVYKEKHMNEETVNLIFKVADAVEESILVDTITIDQLQDLVEFSIHKIIGEDVSQAYHNYRTKRDIDRVSDWKLNSLQKSIWNKKYRNGEETLEEWVVRVSGGDERIAKLIKQRKFLFGGRILYGRGVNHKVTYSNCYVLEPPADNLEDIFRVASQMARTYSFGGGVGFSLSKLRPSGARVNNSAEQTTGIIPFMDLYSQVTQVIGQKGRRGALMLSLSCTHPDLMDFINCKTDLEKVTKANISVEITDSFMNAVVMDEDWNLTFTVPETGESVGKTVKAREIYETLCRNNWDFAEPGILFWDRINDRHLMSGYSDYALVGVNPCAEVPLQAGGSCLLGSLNLSEFVCHPFTKYSYFDIDKFLDAVCLVVVAMNNVLDENIHRHPLQVQRDCANDWRDIGIGVMGLADMFYKLGVKYDTEEALALSDFIASEMLNTALLASSKLASKYGSFNKFDYDKLSKSKFFQDNVHPQVKEIIQKYGLRNSRLLSIAPTGTLSTFFQVSGGIEPIYATKYRRKTQSIHEGDKVYEVYTPICQQALDSNGGEEPSYMVTAHDIGPLDRIEMQGTWQMYVDSAISSTVNLPNTATVEDILGLYMKAWMTGLKGLTVYREGCAREGVLSSGK